MVSDALAGFASGFSRVFLENMKEQGAIDDEIDKYSDILINSINLPEDTTPERRDEYHQLLKQQDPELLQAFVGRQLVNGDKLSITKGPYEQGTGYKLGPESTINIHRATTSGAETEAGHTRRIRNQFNIAVSAFIANNKDTSETDAIRQVFASMGPNEKNIVISAGPRDTEYETRKLLAAELKFLTRNERTGIWDKSPEYTISAAGISHLEDLRERGLLPINPATNEQYDPRQYVDTVQPELLDYILYGDTSDGSVDSYFMIVLSRLARGALSPALAEKFEKINNDVGIEVARKNENIDNAIASPVSVSQEDGLLPSNIQEALGNYLVIVDQEGYPQNKVPRIVNDINSVSSNIDYNEYINKAAQHMLRQANIEINNNNYQVYYDIIINQLLRAYENR
jgi:hypothetical protein